MRTDHSDKAWQPGTLIGRAEYLDELARAEQYRRDHLDPAERAALPTKDEQRLLDDAERALEACKVAYEASKEALAAARQAAAAGRVVLRTRDRLGSYSERPVADYAEQRRLDAEVAAAERAVESETALLQIALRDGNRVRRDVAAAGARRRRDVERDADFIAWEAFRRAHGDTRSSSELRDQFDRKGRYASETIVVRWNGGQ